MRLEFLHHVRIAPTDDVILSQYITLNKKEKRKKKKKREKKKKKEKKETGPRQCPPPRRKDTLGRMALTRTVKLGRKVLSHASYF